MATTIPEEAAAFFAAEYPRLVGALILYTGQPGLAEELAQEALLRACRRWEHVRQLQRPGGWTYRVAMNLANSHFRRMRAARRASRRLGRDETVHHDPDGRTGLPCGPPSRPCRADRSPLSSCATTWG